MKRRVITAVIACAFAFAAVPRALAGELEDRTQEVIEALRVGDVTEAVRLLQSEGTATQIAASTTLTHVLADRAYRFEGLCRAAPPADRRALADVVQMAASAIARTAPDDHRTHWASAHATVLSERTARSGAAQPWVHAAELLEKAHAAHPENAEALGYAVTFLVEGACVAADDRYELRKAAEKLADRALKKHEANVGLATTIASARLWAARTVVGSERKVAKAFLKQAQETLRPFVRRDVPDRAAADLWNSSVTLDRSAGFALREKYVTVTAESLGGSLRFDVPISSRWSVIEVPESEGRGGYVYVTETDAYGAPLRQLLFRRYTWGLQYSFTGPNDVNGDEVKNIARGLQALSVERVFTPGPRTPAVKKTRIGDDLVGHGFEVWGTSNDEEPRPLVLRGACVRGSQQESLAVLVYVYADHGEIGEEMQSVLDSLREPNE